MAKPNSNKLDDMDRIHHPNWRFTPVQKNHLKHATYGWFCGCDITSLLRASVCHRFSWLVNSQVMFVLNQSISSHFCWTLIMFELNKPIISPPCGVPNPQAFPSALSFFTGSAPGTAGAGHVRSEGQVRWKVPWSWCRDVHQWRSRKKKHIRRYNT